MNLILAQVKKDLRALRLSWVCLAGLAALALLVHFQPLARVLDTLGFQIIVNGTVITSQFLFLQFLQLLMIMVFVVALIYEDPLTENTAFWRTRPLPLLQLLGAKFLLMALLLAASQLICCGVAIESETTWRRAVIFMLGVAAFAVTTSNLWQLLGTVLAICLGVHLVDSLIHLVLQNIGFQTVFRYSQIHEEMTYRWANGAWPLFCLAFLGIILHQYLTLRTNASRFLLLLTFFLVDLWISN